jgi:hypothetical protein
MEQTVHKFKWFWAWQDEKEEAWLRAMSQQGWHLVSARPFGVYYFRGGDKSDYVYRLDYQTNRKDKGNYLQLFQDAGWEYIGEMSGWQYFRKRAESRESPEIYTDVESKITKYKRLLGYLLIFLPIYTVVFVNAFRSYPYSWWGITRIIIFVILLLWAYIIIRLSLRIRQLKEMSM